MSAPGVGEHAGDTFGGETLDTDISIFESSSSSWAFEHAAAAAAIGDVAAALDSSLDTPVDVTDPAGDTAADAAVAVVLDGGLLVVIDTDELVSTPEEELFVVDEVPSCFC